MVKLLPASAFSEATLIPSYQVSLTPFSQHGSQEKMEWANRQLDQLYNEGDMLELQVLLHGGPSIATYMTWLHSALKESGQNIKYRLQTKRKGNFLYIRKVERKGSGTEAQVKHVIT
jgi:hypothetical protein